MSVVADVRARVANDVRRRAARTGRAPRMAYMHYFIESEGLHSRIHLQNFYSTFWPQVGEPAVAQMLVHDHAGQRQGSAQREIPPFGSLFLELAELLAEIGSSAAEGTVAIDLEPPAGVGAQFHELPSAEEAEIKTPFWMAYYDDSENYMYVHSIDTLGGEVFGASRLLTWAMTRSVPRGERWHSWRLLEADRLSDLQVVCINHSPEPRSTVVGVYSADTSTTLYEHAVSLGPRALERVRVPAGELAAWPVRHPEIRHLRIGMDPLLTGNGKPYVIMRYAAGPPSLHHG
ncbi:MAG: hypothetical protein ACHP93_00285 [Solirubrobacterales bacterium]